MASTNSLTIRTEYDPFSSETLLYKAKLRQAASKQKSRRLKSRIFSGFNWSCDNLELFIVWIVQIPQLLNWWRIAHEFVLRYVEFLAWIQACILFLYLRSILSQFLSNKLILAMEDALPWIDEVVLRAIINLVFTSIVLFIANFSFGKLVIVAF